jgi:hypothetical protein
MITSVADFNRAEDIEPASTILSRQSESIELRTPLVELLEYGFHVLIDARLRFRA